MPNLDSLFENFLETAATIAVLLVIVSWIASKVVEIGQAACNEHGERLYQEMARCFEEGSENPKNFTVAFYEHPLVKPLSQPQNWLSRSIQHSVRWLSGRSGGGDDRLPAYIAPDTFATVLVGATEPVPASSSRKAGVVVALQGTPAPTALRERIEALNDNSEEDRDAFRAEVARWYSEAMDRATGRFKRSAVKWLIAASFVFCLIFNINFVTILKELLTNSELRATGFQVSEYFRDRPDEMRALGARLLFAQRYELSNGCGLAELESGSSSAAIDAVVAGQKECLRGLLQSLWRDPQRPNMIRSLSFNAPANRPSSQGAGQAIRQEQIERVRNYCDAENRAIAGGSSQRVAFCPAPLVSKLNSCLGDPDPYAAADADQPGRRPTERPPTAPTAAGVPAAPGVANPQAADPAAACARTWSLVWTTPTFVWDTEATRTLAETLAGPPDSPQLQQAHEASVGRLPAELKDAYDDAKADARRIGGFFSALPGVGYIWEHWEWSPGPALYAVFGALLSALLAAFGAPFWYDLLGKVSRRGARGPSANEG